MRYFFLQTALSKTYQENYQVTTQIGKKNIPNKKLSKKKINKNTSQIMLNVSFSDVFIKDLLIFSKINSEMGTFSS